MVFLVLLEMGLDMYVDFVKLKTICIESSWGFIMYGHGVNTAGRSV